MGWLDVEDKFCPPQMHKLIMMNEEELITGWLVPV